MKNMYLFLIAIAFIGILWFAKTDSKDRKARKDAQKVTAVISELRCVQRLKGDKSLVKVKYNTKEYTVFFKNEKDCSKYQLNQEVTAYYSKSFDKLFLDL